MKHNCCLYGLSRRDIHDLHFEEQDKHVSRFWKWAVLSFIHGSRHVTRQLQRGLSQQPRLHGDVVCSRISPGEIMAPGVMTVAGINTGDSCPNTSPPCIPTSLVLPCVTQCMLVTSHLTLHLFYSYRVYNTSELKV